MVAAIGRGIAKITKKANLLFGNKMKRLIIKNIEIPNAINIITLCSQKFPKEKISINTTKLNNKR